MCVIITSRMCVCVSDVLWTLEDQYMFGNGGFISATKILEIRDIKVPLHVITSGFCMFCKYCTLLQWKY